MTSQAQRYLERLDIGYSYRLAKRMEEHCTLPELCRAAAALLRPRGRFALVHRPERLADLMCALRGSGLEPKRMRLLAHGPEHPPSCVLMEAVRRGRPGLRIEP